MSKVRGKDTGPEMAVRRIAHALGYRYRLHCRDLPGTPDLVFRRMKKVIFVHGCLWHRHGCVLDRPPKSRKEFWEAKLQGNKERDRKRQHELRKLGWRVLVLWECQLERKTLPKRIRHFLDGSTR